MRGYRKYAAVLCGILSLYIGGLTLPPEIYASYMYGVTGLVLGLVSTNMGVHFFQGRGGKK